VSKSAASELYPNEDEDSGPYARAAHASDQIRIPPRIKTL